MHESNVPLTIITVFALGVLTGGLAVGFVKWAVLYAGDFVHTLFKIQDASVDLNRRIHELNAACTDARKTFEEIRAQRSDASVNKETNS